METEDGVAVEAQITETKTFSRNKIIALGMIAAVSIFIGGFFVGIFYQTNVSEESVVTEPENLVVDTIASEKEGGSDQSTWVSPQKDQNAWVLPQKMLEEMIPFDEGQQVGDFRYSGYERLDGTSYYVLTFIGTTTLTGKVKGFVDQYTSVFNYYASNYYTFYPDEQSLLKLPTLQIPNESSAVVYDPTDGLWFKALYLYPDAREHLQSVIDSRWCNDRITVNCVSSPVQYTGEDLEIGITEYKLYVCTSSCDNFNEELMFTAEVNNHLNRTPSFSKNSRGVK